MKILEVPEALVNPRRLPGSYLQLYSSIIEILARGDTWSMKILEVPEALANPSKAARILPAAVQL